MQASPFDIMIMMATGATLDEVKRFPEVERMELAMECRNALKMNNPCYLKDVATFGNKLNDRG